jgi:putative transposase
VQFFIETFGLSRRKACGLACTLDNGPEFTSRVLDQWAHAHGVELHFIQAGRPVQTAFAESFNGKFRDECLNTNGLVSLVDGGERIEIWRQDYDGQRPHSSLGALTPEEFARRAA